MSCTMRFKASVSALKDAGADDGGSGLILWA